MDALVTMNEEGRITIPIAARRQLGLDGPIQLRAEVRDGTLVLRPTAVIPRDDLWAYSPEHLASIERARREVGARQLTENELDRLAPSE